MPVILAGANIRIYRHTRIANIVPNKQICSFGVRYQFQEDSATDGVAEWSAEKHYLELCVGQGMK
jgi:hypothetical protein